MDTLTHILQCPVQQSAVPSPLYFMLISHHLLIASGVLSPQWEYSTDVSRQLHSLTALTHSCCCDSECHGVSTDSAVREFCHLTRNNWSTESQSRCILSSVNWRWEPTEKVILCIFIYVIINTQYFYDNNVSNGKVKTMLQCELGDEHTVNYKLNLQLPWALGSLVVSFCSLFSTEHIVEHLVAKEPHCSFNFGLLNMWV